MIDNSLIEMFFAKKNSQPFKKKDQRTCPQQQLHFKLIESKPTP